MLRLALIALALLPLTSCKKDSSKGLPPASDWNAQPPAGSEAAGPSAPRAANPHAGNPHAGMDMGGGGNPHAGMDMSGGGNPHAGIDLSGTAGGDNPQSAAVPQKTQPKTLEKLPDGTLALGPFSVAAPKDWAEKPITSSMRAAAFALPPAAAGADAELIVYYFGEGGAGSVQDNLDRWIGQIVQPDGKPSKDIAKIEQTKFGGQEATYVSVSGRYVAMAMPGGSETVDKPDQTMLAAIVASPRGPYYFKLVGAKKTVDAQAAKFRAMLTSLKIRG